MAGRPRKPTRLKIIQGTFRKHRAHKGEPKPQPITGVPKPPAHLNKFGKALWKKLAPELVRNQLLTSIDLPSFEILCDSYGLYREAKQAMRYGKRSLRQYLAGQTSQTTPEALMMRQCWATYKGLISEFGLSPASRAKLDIREPERPKKDPMEELLNEG